MADFEEPEGPEIPRPTDVTTGDVAPEPRPSGFLWLYYLSFRPARFFRHFVIDETSGLTAVCAWLYGMATVVDRMVVRELQGRPLPGSSDSWVTRWVLIAIMGAIGGLFYFAIGGWWYRLRLKWSGAQDPDPSLARRVYLFASQVAAVPALLSEMSDSLRFATPAEAADSDGGYWYLCFAAFPFWSLWVSYVGVRTAFVVRRGLALLWFLILPGAMYALVIAMVFVALIFMFVLGEADVSDPETHHSRTIRFSYPGNWWIDTEDEDYDPDANLLVEPMQDAWARVMLYESQLELEEELDLSLEAFREIFETWHVERPFDTLGEFAGTGQIIRGEVEGTPCRLRVFVTRIGGDTMLEVREMWAITDEQKVLAGFDLIRSTLRIRQPASASPP